MQTPRFLHLTVVVLAFAFVFWFAANFFLPPRESVLAASHHPQNTGDLDVLGSVDIIGAGSSATIIQAAPGFGDRVFDIRGSI